MALWGCCAALLCFRVGFLLVSVSTFVKCALVDMTCFNREPILSTSANADRTFIGGYKGSTAVEGTISFGRTVVTGTGGDLPTSCSCLLPAIEVRSRNEVFRQYMDCPGDSCSCNGYTDCLYRIGAFYCQIENENHVEKITTITLNEDAVIIPERQTFTVNLGEPVTFRMTTTLDSTAWRWRITSDTVNGWLDRLAGTHPFQIDQVTASDAGVYECHNAGEREQGVHAIFRLIVRACPRNMWGPDDNCQNTCPFCYNGGVCHDKTGECICAPGFSGSYCHVANGRNRWGLSNTRVCTSSQNRHGEACMGRLLCLQDPFGCACAAGYKGISCDQECDEPNTFGPYCSQTCHCADGITCLTDTGECNEPSCTNNYCSQRCASGWKGNNCQVPTPCPDGYYGDTCNDRCNCGENQPCNEGTGDCFPCNCLNNLPCSMVTRECTNGCADGYIGISCVQDGAKAITTFSQTNKPNAGQQVTVICEVVGNPLPAAGNIILQGPGAQQFSFSSSSESPDLNAYRRTNVYIVTGDYASAGTQLTCYLRGEDGTVIEDATLHVDVFDPPYLVSAPFSNSRTATSITIEWNPWTSAQGGDGPVVRYEVQYRLARDDMDDTTYDFMASPAPITSTSLVVSNLDIATEYDFVVIVVREGQGGTGPPSPKATIRTSCSYPTQAPTIMELTTLSDTQLQVTWQLPPESTWQCPSLQRVYVDTTTTGSGHIMATQYEVYETQAVLDSLIPCTQYEVTLWVTNQDGLSSPSDSATATTDSAGLGPVTSLQVFMDSGSPHNQLNVSWFAPTANNCPVESYVISYALTRIHACPSDIISPVFQSQLVDSAITTVSLKDLKPNSDYSVSVYAMNSDGNSLPVEESGRTDSTEPTFIPTVTVLESEVTSSSIPFMWTETPCEEINGRFSSYRYKFGPQASGDPPTTTWYSESITKYSLTPCTTYSFQIAAANDARVGPYSNATEVTTDTEAPSSVQNLDLEEVEGYPTFLQVSWTKPAGNCPVEYYTISYEHTRIISECETVSSSRQVSGNTMDTVYNVTGLLPYSLYYVYVAASTSAGEGSARSDWSYTPEGAPSEAPTSVTSTGTRKRSLSFSWDKPPCRGRGGQIIGYSYRLMDLERDADDTTEDTNGRSVEIGNLVPYTLYSFQVLARTAAGDGPYSESLEMRTDEAKPLAPTSVTTPSADTTSITVEWHRPDPPHGIIIAYHVLYQIVTTDTRQTADVTDGLDQEVLRLQLMELQVDSNYSIQVQAETSVGKGPLSEPVYRITEEGIPGPPSSLRIKSKMERELSIAWDEPMEPNGVITSYTVRYRATDKPYQRDFTPSDEDLVELPILGPSVRSKDISGLSPGTGYNITVAASTSKGEGTPARTEGFTKPMTDLKPPTQPTVDASTSTGTSVVISISAVDDTFVTSYLVAVKKMRSRKRRQSVLNIGDEEYGSFDSNPDSYLAAEIDKGSHNGNFEIGDNKTYGGYYNPPLQEGAMYEVRTGASTKTSDDSYVAWGDPLPITAGDYNQGGDGDSRGNGGGGGGSSGIIGAVVAVALIVCIAAFLAVFVIRRRRAQQSAKPDDSVGMSQLDEPRYAENQAPTPEMKRAASDDALNDLMAKTPQRANTRLTPAGAATLPADIQQKPKPKVLDKAKAGPVKVEKLAEYVKSKKEKSNEGFKADYMNLPGDQIHSWDVAKKEENKSKNRYANIIPYDHSRVILDKIDENPHSDYINATYIDGYKHPRNYIATQGANVASTNDMWRMIWQEKSSIVVMLTHLVEGGKKKCEQYWPTELKYYGPMEVTLETESKFADYVVRTFTAKKDGEARALTQYHYTSWPDMGLPKYASPLLNFVTVVKEGISKNPDMGPIVVHCSAGVGRTGTFITIDAMLNQAKAEGQVEVLKFVSDMRDRRMRMVQTQEQYVFIFDALLEALVCGKTWIPVDNLRQAFNKLKTPSPNGNSTMLEEEFNKLTCLQSPVKGDRFRGGKDPKNVKKNRFTNVLPLDRGRPYLMTMSTDDSTNYINASFINGYWKRDQYIITQIPMPNTSTDFWCMVYDYNSPAIVMLNPVDPNDKTMDKYWPDKNMSAFGPFTVQVVSMESYDGVMCRTFTLDNMNKPNDEAHTVRQFEFQNWSSDADLPTSTVSLLKLISHVERWQGEGPEGPITVQCIDGVRCSGVFCATMSMLDRMKAEKVVDVFQAVKSVRNARPAAVSTLNQYKLCYETAQMQLESFDIYENYR